MAENKSILKKAVEGAKNAGKEIISAAKNPETRQEILEEAEKKYKNAHTNIISVTGERRAFEKGLFDKNCKLIF